jgi:hypothetical protein
MPISILWSQNAINEAIKACRKLGKFEIDETDEGYAAMGYILQMAAEGQSDLTIADRMGFIEKVKRLEGKIDMMTRELERVEARAQRYMRLSKTLQGDEPVMYEYKDGDLIRIKSATMATKKLARLAAAEKAHHKRTETKVNMAKRP